MAKLPIDKLYDVLIVGAGPTGLMMAIECARYGITCAIVEERAALNEKSKAIAVQPRTLEIFHFQDLSNHFLDQGKQIHAGNFSTPSKQIARIDFSSLDSPFPFVLSLEQSKTEAILENHLSTLGIHVSRETALVELEESSDFVTAQLKTLPSGKTERVKAHFVVGCDGAHSTVRKHLDLPFKGKAFSDIFSLADVTIDWEYPQDEISVMLHPKGPVAAIPLPGAKRYRLIFQLERCRKLLDKNNLPLDPLITDNCPPPTIEEAQEALKRFGSADAKLSEALWLANFHINSRLASRYQQGRFFLAGDAAHIHSPIGGQGMNTGLQDAFNLAWKLAFTLKNTVPPSLIDSYHEERYAVAKSLLQATEGATTAVTVHNSIAAFTRNHLATLLLQMGVVKRHLRTAIAQIGIQYPKSKLIQEVGSFSGGPKAGARAPDILLFREGQETTLFHLLQNPTTYFLLIFSGLNPTSEKINQLLSWHLPQGVLPTIPLVVLHSKESLSCLIDPSGKAHQKYGAEKGAVYLLRPDTYIAYRQTPLDNHCLLSTELLARIKKTCDKAS